jgi:hypothetical protein
MELATGHMDHKTAGMVPIKKYVKLERQEMVRNHGNGGSAVQKKLLPLSKRNIAYKYSLQMGVNPTFRNFLKLETKCLVRNF